MVARRAPCPSVAPAQESTVRGAWLTAWWSGRSDARCGAVGGTTGSGGQPRACVADTFERRFVGDVTVRIVASRDCFQRLLPEEARALEIAAAAFYM